MQIIITLFFLAFTAMADDFKPVTVYTPGMDAVTKSNFDYRIQLGIAKMRGTRVSWSITTNNNHIVYHMHNESTGSNWDVNGWPPSISLPYTCKDANSGIWFYVETDGRHVTAIQPDGTILWSKDPFADSHLALYRTQTPRIAYFTLTDKSINIIFNSSQFGTMDIKTGYFTFQGQN